MMNMVDGFEFGITLNGDRIEPVTLPHFGEGGLERAQHLHRGLRAHMLVTIEKSEADDVLDRNHGPTEISILPGLRRAPLALDRIGIDTIAAGAVFRGDDIGRDA